MIINFTDLPPTFETYHNKNLLALINKEDFNYSINYIAKLLSVSSQELISKFELEPTFVNLKNFKEDISKNKELLSVIIHKEKSSGGYVINLHNWEMLTIEVKRLLSDSQIDDIKNNANFDLIGC